MPTFPHVIWSHPIRIRSREIYNIYQGQVDEGKLEIKRCVESGAYFVRDKEDFLRISTHERRSKARKNCQCLGLEFKEKPAGKILAAGLYGVGVVPVPSLMISLLSSLRQLRSTYCEEWFNHRLDVVSTSFRRKSHQSEIHS